MDCPWKSDARLIIRNDCETNMSTSWRTLSLIIMTICSTNPSSRCWDIQIWICSGLLVGLTDRPTLLWQTTSTWKEPHHSNPEATGASSAAPAVWSPSHWLAYYRCITISVYVIQYLPVWKLSFERLECRKGAWDNSKWLNSQCTGVILDNKVFCWTVKYLRHPQIITQHRDHCQKMHISVNISKSECWHWLHRVLDQLHCSLSPHLEEINLTSANIYPWTYCWDNWGW